MTIVEASGRLCERNVFRVIVLHRNEVIKKGLEKILAENPEVFQAKSCDSWPRALALLSCDVDHPTVLIASRSLVGDDIGWRDAVASSVKVLLLLDDLERPDHVPGGEVLADGFLVESALSTRSLADALDQLRRGQVPMPSTMARSLLSEVTRLRELSKMHQVQLTPRELETLRLLVDGLSNKQIAGKLQIGVNGVKRHVSNLLGKLNCPNRTRAAAYAVYAGLVDEDRCAERASC